MIDYDGFKAYLEKQDYSEMTKKCYLREVYDRTKDLEMVRGLLGHENIKLTSRYIRKGEDKAKELLAWTVTW